MPLRPFGELQGQHLHHAVLLGSVGNVDALVNGQAGNLAQIVVRMSADGTNTIGAESHAFRIASVNLGKSLDGFHSSHV